MTRSLIPQRHRLGHKDIDADHAAMNELWQKAVGCAPPEFPLHLARLKRAMKRHFEHEAALLAEVGQCLCVSHQAEHEALLQQCAEASRLYAKSCRKAQSHLRRIFARMVREHVASMDLCAVLTIRTAPDTPCDHMKAR
jgi:hemerythrin-like metal-binding protein